MEAFYAGRSFASAQDIDTAMVLGYKHPIGPKCSDLVGLDVRMDIGTYLAQALNNPGFFEPPKLLRSLVEQGNWKKSGRFYADLIPRSAEIKYDTLHQRKNKMEEFSSNFLILSFKQSPNSPPTSSSACREKKVALLL